MLVWHQLMMQAEMGSKQLSGWWQVKEEVQTGCGQEGVSLKVEYRS